MKVVVASKNPVKLTATKIAFEKMFLGEDIVVEGVKVPSGVSDQPMSDHETHTGAYNRALNAQKEIESADYWVGLEGGVDKHDEFGFCLLGWVVVINKDGLVGRGRSGHFYLPEKFNDLLEQGYEIGDIDDMIFGGENTKQKMGCIGILSKGVIDRTEGFVANVVLALIPFVNSDLY